MKKTILTAIVILAATFSVVAKRDTTVVKPFDRGIGRSNSTFIPKGTVGAGVSLSYNNYNLGNAAEDVGYNMLFSLIQGLHGNAMTFGIAPHVSYFILDNLSIGLRFDYSNSTFGLDNVSLSLTPDLGLSLQDFHYLNQSYTGAATLRNYIPFGDSKRFAMFAEVRVLGGYGQAKTYKSMTTEDMVPYKEGTYQDIYKFETGIVPGIAAFVTNEVALEVSVGLIGFDYKKVVQKTNQVNVSEMEKSGANFKINLLAINFGLSFYIPTGAHRMRKK